MKDSLFRDPAWCLGTFVWLSATLAFPMRLGWTGAGVVALVAYLPVAVVLLLAADVVHNRAYYSSWRALQAQFVLFLLGILAPVTVAFGIGHLGAPANDARADMFSDSAAFAMPPADPRPDLAS